MKHIYATVLGLVFLSALFCFGWSLINQPILIVIPPAVATVYGLGWGLLAAMSSARAPEPPK